MTYNESRKKSAYAYKAKNVRRIPLDVQNDEYDRIKASADAVGESVNGYIKTAVRNRMDSEGPNTPSSPN